MDGIPAFVTDFLNYMETIKGKSKNTVKEYFYDLRLFLRYLKAIKKLSTETVFEKIEVSDVTIDLIREVTLSDLYSYMSFLTRERDLSATSRARKVASIKSFFNYLFGKAGIIDFNPANELESPKIMKRLPKYLNIEESKMLLNSVEGKHMERDFAIITMFLNCGLRLSELVNLNISKMKLQYNNSKVSEDTLTVIGKGNKERTIYLNKACTSALEAYLKVRPRQGLKDNNALFLSERNQRISNKTVQYIIKKYIKSAGLDTERYSTHKLRHTAATLMYKHGNVDIRALQEILGHESISTTEIYTHVDNRQLKNAVERNPLSEFTSKRKGLGA